MPELPDLLHMQKYLATHVCGKTVTAVRIKQPIVLRILIDRHIEKLLLGNSITEVTLRGPFIRFALSDGLDLVMNLMLAGKIQHQHVGEKPEGYLCFSLSLADGSILNFCDEQLMVKAYLVPNGSYAIIPQYEHQGMDILSEEFTLERFSALATKHSRKQVRTFINDHTILSAIGNAYADEILFDAKIHPKTFVTRLSPAEIETLYSSILSVIAWGTREVEKAQQPIHVKVRDHLKVRNRRGQPCPRCATTIRREGVRGYDVFFCPNCQPASRKLFIQWRQT